MASETQDSGTALVLPHYFIEFDGVTFANNKVPSLKNYIPLHDWGFGLSHLSGNDSVGPYDPKQPPAASLLYLRLPTGGYLPTFVSNLFNKKVMKKAMLIRLGNLTTTDQILSGMQFESVTIEKILFGNTAPLNLGETSVMERNLEDASFVLFVRFLKLRVMDHEFEQDGSKKGQTASSFDFTTGKVGK